MWESVCLWGGGGGGERNGVEGCYGSGQNFKPSEGPAPSMGGSGMCGDEGGVERDGWEMGD